MPFNPPSLPKTGMLHCRTTPRRHQLDKSALIFIRVQLQCPGKTLSIVPLGRRKKERKKGKRALRSS